MSLSSPGEDTLLHLPYAARMHLFRIISHIRTLHPELEAAWDTIIAHVAMELAHDAQAWIPGLRKARGFLSKEHFDIEPVEEGKKDGKRKGKGKAKEKEGGKTPKSCNPSPARPSTTAAPQAPDESALHWLHMHILGSSFKTADFSAPYLLVLTFGPPMLDEHDALHAKPMEEPACTWNKDEFCLPPLPIYQNDAGGAQSLEISEGELIFPVSDLPSHLTSLSTFQVVGGTIRIAGARSASEDRAVRAVIRIAVYTSLSLLLESHLLNSFYIASPPSPPQSRAVSPAAPSLSSPLPPTEVRPAPLRHKPKPSAIWGFLTKPRGSLRILRSPLFPQTPTTEVPPPLPPAKDGSSTQTPLHPSAALSKSKSLPRTPPRFAHMLDVLSTVPFSTSPSVSFPAPSLLLRLRAKESAFLASQRGRAQHRLANASIQAASTSRSRSRERDLQLRLSGEAKIGLKSLQGGEETLEGWIAQQGMSVLYSSWVPIEDGGPSSRSVTSTSASDMTTSSSRQSALTESTVDDEKIVEKNTMGEEAPGLDLADTDAQGKKKPSIASLPTAPASRTCTPPSWRTYRYFCRTRDRTLGQMVQYFCSLPGDKGDACCTRERCAKPLSEHRWGWACSGIRVEAGLQCNSGPDVASGADEAEEKDAIHMWSECGVCGARSEKTRMNDETHLFSFAKYLELLLFSQVLPYPSLCEHTRPPSGGRPADAITSTTSLSLLQHHFSHTGTTVTFSLSSLDVYELCLPRLQIGETSPSIVDSSLPPRTESPLPMADASKEQERKDKLRLEITAWFGNAKRWTKSLENHLRERKRLPRRPQSEDSRSVSIPAVPSHRRLSDSEPEPTHDLTAVGALRASLRNDELSLYGDLKPWSTLALNDVRRRFMTLARSARERMEALAQRYASAVGPCTWNEPDWWRGDLLLCPGSWVIVKEDEPGSIISYTLSSIDYRRALEDDDPTVSQIMSSSPSHDAQQSTITSTSTSSKFAPEIWSAVVTRRETPRDVGALLSMQVLGGRKSVTNGSPSRKSLSGSSPSRLMSSGTPKKAWAEPDVAVSYQSAQGDLHAADEVIVEQLLQGMETDAEGRKQAMSPPLPNGESAGSSDIANPRKPSVSMSSASSQRLRSHLDPSQSTPTSSSFSTSSSVSQAPSEATLLPEVRPNNNSDGLPSDPLSESRSGFATLSNAVRYLTDTTRTFLSFSGSESSPVPTSHLPLLAVDRAHSAFPAIEERPHIRYDCALGKRLKFTCTVYYAQQFEALRRLCGVETSMIESLVRSVQWKAEGGKSRSQFFKSEDDRFIIKSLVNAWHVADLHVLFDVAPPYFRYLESLGDKPTSLAKLLGFYSLEVKNLVTSTQTKVDFLVMENLFYNHQVDRQFDLKGIEGRKVKTSDKKTLFDVEWMESQQSRPIFVAPHSRLVVRDAIRQDAKFLTSSNIMDYSLLVGVNDNGRQITCGLVDTIGSYNVAKTLEYTAKQSLKSGKEVTVMPPAEYEARFVGAMETYFVSCPEKWSRRTRQSPEVVSPSELPSVL